MFLWLKVFGFKSQVQRGHEQVEMLVGKAHHLAMAMDYHLLNSLLASNPGTEETHLDKAKTLARSQN